MFVTVVSHRCVPTLLLASACGLFGYLLPFAPIFDYIAAGLVFVALLIVFGIISRDDIEKLSVTH